MELGQHNFDDDFFAERKSMPSVATKIKSLRPSIKNIYYYSGNPEDADLVLEYDTGFKSLLEVKEDKYCAVSGRIAIEVSCNGKDSGINRTKADEFLYVVHTHLNQSIEECEFVFIPTPVIRKIAEESNEKIIIEKAGDGGRAKVYLFNFEVFKQLVSQELNKI